MPDKYSTSVRNDLGARPPVNVCAPIITGTTRPDVAPFVDFVENLKHHNNVEIAAAENTRLAPYIQAMSVYLSKAADRSDLRGKQKEKLKSLTTTESLSHIFNAMASCTRNTLISDVAILPNTITWAEDTKKYFHGEFSIPFNHRGYPMEFGFLQVFEKVPNNMKQSSTSFPTFMLEAYMLESINDFNPKELLKPLQQVMTLVNHDALHHFTSPIINPSVAHNFQSVDSSIQRWTDRYAPRYEAWAHMGHEKVLLDEDNKNLLSDTRLAVDTYFDRLEKISKALPKDLGSHETIDYFGMVMGHALTRIYPLDHEIITHCIDRLRDIDPFPDETAETFFRTTKKSVNDKADPQDTKRIIADYMSRMRAPAREVIHAYYKAGFDMSNSDTPAETYRTMKRLELIEISHEDTLSHAPVSPGSKMGNLRGQISKSMLKMIDAAASTVDYKQSLGSKIKNTIANFGYKFLRTFEGSGQY